MQQGAWLDRLEREHDNLRVALKWARERDEMETGMRVARALWRFWYTRGHAQEGQEWFEGQLAQTEGDGECSPSVVVRVQALFGAGMLAYMQDDYGRAAILFKDSLALSRDVGDKHGMAAALSGLGNVALQQGIYGRAAELYEDSLALFRKLEHAEGITTALSLAEPLRTIMDNGGRRALIPIENKRNFLEVSADIVERVDPVFYSDPMTAALKALGLK